MKITLEQREERYQKLTDELLQELYAGEKTGMALRRIFDDYHLPNEVYREYAIAFGDVVLDLEEEAHMPRILSERLGLSEKLATVIAHDLLEFINTHKASVKTMPPQDAPAAPLVPTPEASSSIPTRSELPLPPTPVVPQATEEAPTWSRRIAPPSPAPQSNPAQNAPQAPAIPSSIPQYARPYTDVPRYIPDPYREPPK